MLKGRPIPRTSVKLLMEARVEDRPLIALIALVARGVCARCDPIARRAKHLRLCSQATISRLVPSPFACASAVA